MSPVNTSSTTSSTKKTKLNYTEIKKETMENEDTKKSLLAGEKQREIEEDGNKIKHSVKYLKHKTNGHIITSQFKAWNDTIRRMMWLDLVLGPIQRKMLQIKLSLLFVDTEMKIK